MLEGLDQVPWGELSTAYGSGEAIPLMLRRLAAGDPEALDAYRDDAEGLIHQGCVYSATAAAVPFLVEPRSTLCRGPPRRPWR